MKYGKAVKLLVSTCKVITKQVPAWICQEHLVTSEKALWRGKNQQVSHILTLNSASESVSDDILKERTFSTDWHYSTDATLVGKKNISRELIGFTVKKESYVKFIFKENHHSGHVLFFISVNGRGEI